MERRAEVLGESLVGNVEPQLDKGSLKELQRVVERFSGREHLAGVAVFNAKLEPIAESSQLTQSLQSQSIAVPQAIVQNKKQSQFVHLASGSVHILALPLHRADQVAGELVIVHDASYIDAQTAHAGRETFWRALVQVVLISLITLLIVRWSIAGPIARAAKWMKSRTTAVGKDLQHRPSSPVPRLPYSPSISLPALIPTKGMKVSPIYWTSTQICPPQGHRVTFVSAGWWPAQYH